jgi:hypothetical protein
LRLVEQFANESFPSGNAESVDRSRWSGGLERSFLLDQCAGSFENTAWSHCALCKRVLFLAPLSILHHGPCQVHLHEEASER